MCAFKDGWMPSAKIDFCNRKKIRLSLYSHPFFTQTLFDQHIHTLFKAFVVHQNAEVLKHIGSNLTVLPSKWPGALVTFTREFPSNPVTFLHQWVYKIINSTLVDLYLTMKCSKLDSHHSSHTSFYSPHPHTHTVFNAMYTSTYHKHITNSEWVNRHKKGSNTLTVTNIKWLHVFHRKGIN